MRVVLPINVELKGKAHSRYNEDTIDRRLAAIADREDVQAEDERAFLAKLRVDLRAGSPE